MRRSPHSDAPKHRDSRRLGSAGGFPWIPNPNERISERLSTLVIDVSSSKDPEEVVAAAVFEVLDLGERLPLVNDRRPEVPQSFKT